MPRHVVVDGSNLATEGRANPSLAQLNDVVMSWLAEHPTDLITVVVDATFGHRIDSKEVKAFDEAVENNEIVAPPAGAVGRGDAFVLAIADKVKATILSNDSFQEFHGDYDWLFEEGRLVGGKPVPHVGWVFVERVPVRGPTSRKAVRDAKRKNGDADSTSTKAAKSGKGAKSGKAGTGSAAKGAKDAKASSGKASKAASQPMPVPTAPPPSAIRPPAPAAPEVDRKPGHHLNDLLPFLTFVETHPVGTPVSATVDAYSSHGAYVTVGDVTGYVPLRLMADPPPRSAREVMGIGEAVTLVVAGFNPARRGVDLGLPAMVPTVEPPARKAGAKKTAGRRAAATKAPAKTSPATTAPTGPAAGEAALGDPAPVEAATAAKTPAAKTPAPRTPAKRAPAKKAPAKKAPAKKTPAKTASARTAPAKKAPAAKASATKAAVGEAPATKAPAPKAPTKKAPAKKAPSTRGSAEKAPAKRAPARKAPTKKAPAGPGPGPS